MRQLIVKPLGLVTRPNIYGVYPEGALSLAQNLVMRAPGILEAAPATVLGLSFGASNEVVHDITPVDGAMISVAFGAQWTVRRNAAAFAPPPSLSGSTTFSATGRISAFTARDRVFINSPNGGLLVIDDTTAAGTLRSAGMPQAKLWNATINNDNGPALPSHYVAGYTAVYRRKFADGYEIVGEPSPIMQLFNPLSNSSNTQIQVACASSIGLAAGDIVELYKTNVIEGAIYHTQLSTTDPGTTCQLIGSHTLTSSDLLSGSVVMQDASNPGPLGVTGGQALYTNPGQDGAPGANKRPPIANCCALFKGYAFYGSITELPLLKFNIPAGNNGANSGLGADFNNAVWRTNGVGVRAITGTVTSGTNTITGISAAHMLGLKVGQVVGADGSGSAFSYPTTITAVGGSSVTLSANATGSGTGASVYDRLVLNGVTYDMGENPANTLFRLSIGSTGIYAINTSEVSLSGQNPATGFPKIDYFISPSRAQQPTSTNVLTVRATNGANYDPPLPEITAADMTITSTPRPSTLVWSKDSQPEHVPVSNVTQVGNGEIIALEPTRDALWIFCTDGLYRLSGAGGVWRVDPVDTTLVLSSPRASCVLRDVVYCYTNQGFGRVTDTGFEALGDALVGDLLPGAEYTETASIILERNEAEDEIVIRVDATQVYVYSVRENAYTTLVVPDVTCMAYVRYPVSGAACLAFGRSPSGSTPRYELWNAPTSKLAAQAQFQPLYGKDPFATKHWVDASFIFDAQSAGALVTPYWNAVASPASALVGGNVFVKESRRNFGIPRSAPAVGNSLTVGYAIPAHATRPGKLYAVSLRYRQFGEENLKRLANAG